jgi:hypothetical protein
MLRTARLPHASVLFFTMTLPWAVPLTAAQQLYPVEVKQTSHALSQPALKMLDEVLKEAKNLAVPQNRLALESEALPVLWKRDESRARALISQMVTDFADATTARKDDSSQSAMRRQVLLQKRQQLVQTLGQLDPQLAFDFLHATRSYAVQQGSSEDRVMEEQLEMNLASQITAQDPWRGLKLIETQLQAGAHLPADIANALSNLQSRDPHAASQLFKDALARLKTDDLVSDRQNFYTALNLLNFSMPPPGVSPLQPGPADTRVASDSQLKQLADIVATAALSPMFPRDALGTGNNMLDSLQRYAPDKVSFVQARMAEYMQGLDPQTRAWQAFAQMNGHSLDEQLALISQSPANIRTSLYQQIASQCANAGDYLRARQIAMDHIADPTQRDQILNNLLQNAASTASQQGQISLARQLVEQIASADERVNALVQIARNAAQARQVPAALEILEEAESLTLGPDSDQNQYNSQMLVAKAFAELEPRRGTQMLEPVAEKINQLLAAGAQVDGFGPWNRSFEHGELLLENGYFVGTLLRPYADGLAALAPADFAAAASLAGRLQLPEARLLAGLMVARAVLDQP